MKYYYRDFSSGATACIIEHRDGTATLRVRAGKLYTKKYKSKRSALCAWARWCA